MSNLIPTPEEGLIPLAYPTAVVILEENTQTNTLLTFLCEVPYAGLHNSNIKYSNYALPAEDYFNEQNPGFMVTLFAKKGTEQEKLAEFLNTKWDTTSEVKSFGEKYKGQSIYPGTPGERITA